MSIRSVHSVHMAGLDLHDEQHVQASEEDAAWKKPQASRPLAGVRRNARQEVSTFRGAGARRRARTIRRTVASLTW